MNNNSNTNNNNNNYKNNCAGRGQGIASGTAAGGDLACPQEGSRVVDGASQLCLKSVEPSKETR